MKSQFSTVKANIYLFSYDDLKKIFGRYGRIVDITLPLDYYTRDAKGKVVVSSFIVGFDKIFRLGYGFVEYEESRDAGNLSGCLWDWIWAFDFFVEEALHALDRYRLLGRELEVEFARGDRKSMLIYSFKNKQQLGF